MGSIAPLFWPAPAHNPVREAIERWLVARCMDLRLGDGTQIESIRRGDGTEIAEVRKGDGTVLWQADVIPDSVVEHMDLYWPMDEGSGSTLTDSIGDVDGSIQGATWDSDLSFGTVTQYDGVDDLFESVDTVFDSPSNYSFGKWVYIESISDDNTMLFGAGDDPRTDGNDMDPGGVSIHQSGTEDWRHLHMDGGSGSTSSTFSVSDSFNNWIFACMSVDVQNDDSEIFLFDDGGGLLDSSSYSDSIGQPSDLHLRGMYREDAGYATEGYVAEVMASESYTDESDWQEIVNETKP